VASRTFVTESNVFDTGSGTDTSTEARPCCTGPNLMAHYEIISEIGLPGRLADLTRYHSQMTDPGPISPGWGDTRSFTRCLPQIPLGQTGASEAYAGPSRCAARSR
jgi:hypothetical protein